MVFWSIPVSGALMPVNPSTEAVLLRDDAMGVSTESKVRKIQHHRRDDTYEVSLNSDWLSQLNLASQSAQTVQSMSIARKPVIVQNPAIIVQPASVIGGDSE